MLRRSFVIVAITLLVPPVAHHILDLAARGAPLFEQVEVAVFEQRHPVVPREAAVRRLARVFRLDEWFRLGTVVQVHAHVTFKPSLLVTRLQPLSSLRIVVPAAVEPLVAFLPAPLFGLVFSSTIPVGVTEGAGGWI